MGNMRLFSPSFYPKDIKKMQVRMLAGLLTFPDKPQNLPIHRLMNSGVNFCGFFRLVNYNESL